MELNAPDQVFFSPLSLSFVFLRAVEYSYFLIWQYGWSALHIAACNGHLEVIKALLSSPDLDTNGRSLVFLYFLECCYVSSYFLFPFRMGGQLFIWLAKIVTKILSTF